MWDAPVVGFGSAPVADHGALAALHPGAGGPEARPLGQSKKKNSGSFFFFFLRKGHCQCSHSLAISLALQCSRGMISELPGDPQAVATVSQLRVAGAAGAQRTGHVMMC